MKKRKTRKQKIALGLKREIIKIDINIKELSTEFSKQCEYSIEQQKKLNEERKQNKMLHLVSYSRADALNTCISYWEIEKIDVEQKLKELNNKRGNRK